MTFDEHSGKWFYDTAYQHRKNMKARRDRNRAAGVCVNENATGTHGKAVYGVRCAACDFVWRLTRDKKSKTLNKD